MLVSAVVFLVKIYVQCGLVDAVLLLYRFFIRFHKIEPVKDAIGQDEARKELKLCRCVVFHTSKVRSFDTQTYLQVYVYVTLCHGSLQVSQKAALEFCVAGSISCSNTDTEEYFKNMNNAALNRYDSDNAGGQYWASDITEDENYSYRNYSYMDFTADNITGENTSYKKNEAMVRTISGASYHGFSVRCVKSIE